jgi:hypothetical protein
MNSEAQLAKREVVKPEMAAVIRIEVTEDDGLFIAQSPDMHGLIVSAYKIDALLQAVPQGIEKLYRARGVRVIATRAQADLPGYAAFIAVPVGVAETALRRLAETV